MHFGQNRLKIFVTFHHIEKLNTIFGPSIFKKLQSSENFNRRQTFLFAQNMIPDFRGAFYDISDYQFQNDLKKLGHGSFGTVYAIKNIRDNKTYAIKILG